MSALIPVPRYGDQAILILYCGHVRSDVPYQGYGNGSALRQLLFNCLFNCSKGCGGQYAFDMIVWKP